MKRHRNALLPETVARIEAAETSRPFRGWVPDHRADPHPGDHPRKTVCDGRGCDHDRCAETRRTMDRQATFIEIAGPRLWSVMARTWAPDTAVRL